MRKEFTAEEARRGKILLEKADENDSDDEDDSGLDGLFKPNMNEIEHGK